MDFLRKHWFDLGGILSGFVLLSIFCFSTSMDDYDRLMWLSLVSLFWHQLEEYRIVGTFPGMINRSMFHSDTPDRYPLNTNTSLIVNVLVGWLFYFLAALIGKNGVWLGIATMLVSLGNIFAHTFAFNIKGKTIYNAGMATSWLLFAPIVYFFIQLLVENHLATATDFWIGIPLGIILNVLGILKMITWLADKNSPYAFEQRQLLPKDRK